MTLNPGRRFIDGRLRTVLFALVAMLIGMLATNAYACPNPGARGQIRNFTGQQLWAPQRFGVVAGGNVNLNSCGGIPGHGWVISAPDFAINLTNNAQNYDLEFRVEGTCDTVLLVNDSSGRWHFNDDTNGFDPRIRLNQARTGVYDIWVGTFGQSTCQATMIFETFGGTGGGGGGGGQPPQPPQVATCPDPSQNGQYLSYNGQQLWSPQRHSVVAGGGVDLGACQSVPGHGRVARRPDYTLNFTRNNPGYDLDFRVEGTCDTVLLVRGPNGQWHYNDDTDGFHPRIRVGSAAVGEYDVWVGTFGQSTCQATVVYETFGGTGGGGSQPPQPPQPPVAALCPDPAQNGQMLAYDGQQLWTPQSFPVTAGGNVNLGNCHSVQGHGYIIQRPDFTLNFTHNPQNYALEFRVVGTCDPVLLVYGPNGQWSFNDDADGLNSRLRIDAARTGQYDIWVGTYGASTCQATLYAETYPSAAPPPPPPPPPVHGTSYPVPMLNGERVDWCRIWGSECGQPAADAYCRWQGHGQASSWEREPVARSWVQGTQQICSNTYQGVQCDALRNVVCTGGAPSGGGGGTGGK